METMADFEKELTNSFRVIKEGERIKGMINNLRGQMHRYFACSAWSRNLINEATLLEREVQFRLRHKSERDWNVKHNITRGDAFDEENSFCLIRCKVTSDGVRK